MARIDASPRDWTITRSSVEIILVTAVQEGTLLRRRPERTMNGRSKALAQYHPFLLAFRQKKIR